ncbi:MULTISPECIES: ABC transporter permease [Campylobacter]|uniref:ABC transporter permease n=1 Tax=Campylobacter TaxID=194 RepID=UPI000A333EC3|nr:ABC transporter permease [Campylobacter sp. P0124]MCR8696482.1 ABC transporter permease [Campylobacter sp. RM19073]
MVRYLLFKYLRFDKSQPFIALSAILAFLGVSVGLMVLIIAMAIMNGFDKEFERKLFTMNYPITIISYIKGSIDESDVTGLKEQFKELKFSPYISTQAIVKYGNKLEGGVLFGVNFSDEKQINSVINEALKDTIPKGFEVVLGKGIADDFSLALNDKVTILFTQLSPSGLVSMPTMKRFDYVANFSSGLNAYDKAYSYTNIEFLAKILGYEDKKYDGIHIYSDNPKDDIIKLNQLLKPGQKAIGWWEQNGNFFSALELEKRALFIVLMLIILVASLNIISSLLMTVMNRRQEIALLLALGASKMEIKKSFFAQGVVIGGSGIVFGLILGLFGVWLLGSFDIINLPADVYGSSKLPMELSIYDLAMILVGALIIVLLSSYYPAKKASNIDILTTLRNE